jgi:hypothetical protein
VCRAGYGADHFLSASDVTASGQVLHPSELTLLQTEPDLLLSAPILSQSGQDLGGQVLSRIVEEKVRHRAMKVRKVSDPLRFRSGAVSAQSREVQFESSRVRSRSRRVRSRSRRVRKRSRKVRFQLATFRLRFAAAKCAGIADDSLDFAPSDMTMAGGARLASVGHIASLTDGTARVPNFRQTLFGSKYDFLRRLRAAPRNREIARGSETMRRMETMSGIRPSFVMRRRQASFIRQ